MIVARGFGRGGYSTVIPASGLGRHSGFFGGGGGGWQTAGTPRRLPTGTTAQDARDLAEILPAILGVLYGNS